VLELMLKFIVLQSVVCIVSLVKWGSSVGC